MPNTVMTGSPIGMNLLSTDLLPDCDALLVFNTAPENIHTFCNPEKVVAFMMEPGIRNKHPWMFKGLDQYHKVYSPVAQSANAVLSHGFLGWYFHHDFTCLKDLAVPEKTRSISCIVSGLKQLEGHRLRLDFVKTLQEQFEQIDFFGRDTHFLSDKMDGLLPYRYSIAMENSSQPYYFTEKINDCFLAYTVPVYYGCKNISRYFPERSFVQIDIENPKQSTDLIESLLVNDDWQSRLDAVKEARELVLTKYQPLAGAAAIFRETHAVSEKKNIVVKTIRTDLLKRLKTKLYLSLIHI